jgi:hypothetical protein
VTQSAIFVAWSSLVLISGIAKAQERPWEVFLAVHSFNTFYEEDFKEKDGNPAKLEGNGWTAAALHATITYRGRQQLRLPFYITIEGELPLVLSKRLEVGHEYAPSGTVFLTQSEDITHRFLEGRAIIGFELLPFLQPYVGLSRSNVRQRRMNQLDGQYDSTLKPDKDKDYNEDIFATFVDVGIEGIIPLNANADIRLRYDLGYKTPQTVFISNDYFDPGTWGQGTTGYEYGGRVQLDLPLYLFDLFERHSGYWTIGGTLTRLHWNGDGRTGDEIFRKPHWPENTGTNAGGFIGLGLFF